MKKLLLSASLLISALGAQAQLAPGSIAPDFTVSAYQPWLSTAGMNNNGTYNLYDYLDAGYTVILDVSATWCGPCKSLSNNFKHVDMGEVELVNIDNNLIQKAFRDISKKKG